MAPQSSGLLLGRADLIAGARANNAPSSATIGRGMKVNKEEMLGIMVALEFFLERDHAREWADWERRVKVISDSITAVPGVKAEMYLPEIFNRWPHIRVTWDEAATGIKPRRCGAEDAGRGAFHPGLDGGKQPGPWCHHPQAGRGPHRGAAARNRNCKRAKPERERQKSVLRLAAVLVCGGALPFSPASVPIDNKLVRVALSAGVPGVVTKPHVHETNRVMIYFDRRNQQDHLSKRQGQPRNISRRRCAMERRHGHACRGDHCGAAGQHCPYRAEVCAGADGQIFRHAILSSWTPPITGWRSTTIRSGFCGFV